MKKIVLLISVLLVFISIRINGQIPQAISFQGIATDDQGNQIIEKEISVEVKILQGNANGTEQYIETHQVKTNEYGLYSLSIGMGNVSYGNFADINWSNIPMFVSIGIDAEGGSNYQFIGANQLLSVPYALMSGSSNIDPKIYVQYQPSDQYHKITLINGSSDFSSFRYFYSWIHGEPEDVFVEFKNMPSNIDIVTNARGGVGLGKDIINNSKVDTIVGGQMKPNSFIRIADVNKIIPTGNYPLQLIFRTETKTLDSLSFNLIIQSSSFSDCLPDLPVYMQAESKSCQDNFNFPDVVLDTIYVEENSFNSISITDLFENDHNKKVNFYMNNCSSNTSYDWSKNNFDFYLLGFEIIDKKINFTFEVNDKGDDSTHECILIYR